MRAHADVQRQEEVARKERAQQNAQISHPEADSVAGLLAGRTNHYRVLDLCFDHSESELKQAYRQASRRFHPDKHQGSTAAFQRITAAHDILSDPKKRLDYDNGDDIERELQSDGSQGPGLRERVERQYFPDRFSFEPFGDPYERKRQHEEDKKQKAPEEPNGPDIPNGNPPLASVRVEHGE